MTSCRPASPSPPWPSILSGSPGQTELRKGGKKPAKIPYDPNTRSKAKANDPTTWGDRPLAETRASALPKPYGTGGVGLELAALGDGRSLGGIDLDTCRDLEAGAIEDWARVIIDRLASYTEVSPSRTGMKVFFLFSTEDHDAIRRALGTHDERRSKIQLVMDTERPGTTIRQPSRSTRATAISRSPISSSMAARMSCARCRRRTCCSSSRRTVRRSRRAEVDPGSRRQGHILILMVWKRMPPSQPMRVARSGSAISSATTPRAASPPSASAQRPGVLVLTTTPCAWPLPSIPDTREWYFEKGEADGGRELRRIWDKTDPFGGELIVPRGAPLVTAKQFVGRLHTLHDGIAGSSHRTIHHQNASFYSWQRTHYGEQTAEEMRAALYRFLDTAKTIDPDTGQTISFDPTKHRVANVLEALAAQVQIARTSRPPAWLTGAPDAAPDPAMVLSCQNGLLDLSDYRLHPHTPALFSLNALPFDYVPKPPPPASWLHSWTRSGLAILGRRRLCRSCLVWHSRPDTTHQKAFLMVGPKRSGKGTIARILTEMLGATNVCSPTLSSLSSNFGLAPLIGKRLAIISDARLSGKSDQAVIAERILAITGEDALTIDRKFREAWTGKLDVRFLVLTNELPRLTDTSGALASRFIILVMTRSFYGNEDRGLLGQAAAGTARIAALEPGRAEAVAGSRALRPPSIRRRRGEGNGGPRQSDRSVPAGPVRGWAGLHRGCRQPLRRLVRLVP